MDLDSVVRLTDEQITTIENEFGERGRQWILEYPDLVSRCQQRWGLKFESSLDGGLAINQVIAADSSIFGSVVLKIGVPHPEQTTEMNYLTHFEGAGRPVVSLLDKHEDDGAILLRRIQPGHPLRFSELDDLERSRVAGQIAAILPLKDQEDTVFPRFSEWLSQAFSQFNAGNGPKRYPEFARLVARVSTLFDRFGNETHVLHGDLHHENILAADSGWTVIDPKGVIGPPCMETGRFLHNFIDETNVDELARVMKLRAAVLAQALSTELAEVINVGFVDIILSTCWSLNSKDDETDDPALQQAFRKASALRQLMDSA